jgi:tRNA (guanine9-N1)-methyltransferase
MDEEDRPRKMQKLEHEGPEGSEVPGQKDVENDATGSRQQSDTKENAPNAETGLTTAEPAPLSKKQQKRLLKMQKWDERKDERKELRKKKRHERQERKREKKKNGELVEAPRRTGKSVLVPVTFVIDCGWDELMNDRERVSLGSQITRSYSDNVKAPYRTHFVVSSFDKLLKERFDTVLRKTYLNWRGVRFMTENFDHAALQAKDWMKAPEGGGTLEGAIRGKEGNEASPEDGEIVYLSSDSSETLTELKPYSTYIIGGLVDKNRHKGVCHKRATELGIRTAKLPIGDYLRMASRHVLATNHVVEIMLKWLELGDWGQAFMQVIPQRKGGALKTAESEHETKDTPEQADKDPDEEAESSGVEDTAEAEAEAGIETTT